MHLWWLLNYDSTDINLYNFYQNEKFQEMETWLNMQSELSAFSKLISEELFSIGIHLWGNIGEQSFLYPQILQFMKPFHILQ